MHTRTAFKRSTLVAATALAAAMSVAALTSTTAGASTPATGTYSVAKAVATSSGDPRSAVNRVSDFYGAYIDTVWTNEDPAADDAAKALRSFYLSKAAQKKVAAFEAREHADGILFAQNVPVKWKVTYTGSGAGHATSLVTLTWSDGADAQVTKIKVQSSLQTLKITDIAPAD
ncbi:hypothetical protein [Streptomyces flavofungini]|uniref:hypothetical protein n=1 Tax=Streptomyces flavofungini TaxID=68200 RepID=UPI0034DDE6EA